MSETVLWTLEALSHGILTAPSEGADRSLDVREVETELRSNSKSWDLYPDLFTADCEFIN